MVLHREVVDQLRAGVLAQQLEDALEGRRVRDAAVVPRRALEVVDVEELLEAEVRVDDHAVVVAREVGVHGDRGVAQRVELARQNYDVVRNRYANELALVTDMLDANNAKLMAEVELANARVSIIFNYYKLLYLSGNI